MDWRIFEEQQCVIPFQDENQLFLNSNNSDPLQRRTEVIMEPKIPQENNETMTEL